MQGTYAHGQTILNTRKVNVNQHIEMIPTDRIIAGAYQRELTASRVAKIVGKFDPAKLGVLLVNQRGNGSYAILDGQHRLAALRIVGVPEVRCIALKGLSPEEEVDYFRFQNENTRALTAYDLFNAGVCAKDVHFVTLNYLLKLYGFSVSRWAAHVALLQWTHCRRSRRYSAFPPWSRYSRSSRRRGQQTRRWYVGRCWPGWANLSCASGRNARSSSSPRVW